MSSIRESFVGLNLTQVLASSKNNRDSEKPTTSSSERTNNSTEQSYHNQKRGDFHNRLLKTWKSQDFIDCFVSTLEFGSENLIDFPCHKIILAAGSPKFAELIQKQEQDHCQENENVNGDSQDKPLKMVVEGVRPAVLEKMLTFLYSSAISLTDEIVVDVFTASNVFGMVGLQKLCEEHVSLHISSDSVLDLLLDAEKHSAATLKEKCLEFVKDNASELFERQEDKILSLPKNCFSDILGLNFRMDEHALFEVSIKWGQQKMDESAETLTLKQVMSGLMEKIRFVSLRKTFLQDKVLPLGIVPDHIIMDVLFFKAKDPAYLEFQQVETTSSSSAAASATQEVKDQQKMWLRPRGRIWKSFEDFGNEQAFTDYMKSVLKPGMRLMALRSYESVAEGDVGEFVQWNTGIPPCQVRWEGYGSTYWLYFRDLIIIEE